MCKIVIFFPFRKLHFKAFLSRCQAELLAVIFRLNQIGKNIPEKELRSPPPGVSESGLWLCFVLFFKFWELRDSSLAYFALKVLQPQQDNFKVYDTGVRVRKYFLYLICYFLS